jgi:uncharacterized Fe-S cluster-containing radical SAM superfamily enzyme
MAMCMITCIFCDLDDNPIIRTNMCVRYVIHVVIGPRDARE